MSGSLKLFSIRGIDIRVHFTFPILFLFAGALGYSLGSKEDMPAVGALVAILIICAIFVCVTIHEIGHSLVAQKCGVGVRDITLFPFGGLASLASPPEDPNDEWKIAVVGPLLNFFIALVLLTPFFLRWLPWVPREELKFPIPPTLSGILLWLALI